MSAIWNNKVLDKVHKYLSAGNTMPRHSFSMCYGNYKNKQLLCKLNDHDCIEHNKVLSNHNKYMLAGDKIFNHHRKINVDCNSNNHRFRIVESKRR